MQATPGLTETAYLIVQVAARACALPLEPGMEVLRVPEFLHAPQQAGAAGLLGLAEIRGQLTPVLDLRVLLGLPPDGEPPTRLVTLHLATLQMAVGNDSRPVALAVQSVAGVSRLAADQLQTILLPQAADQTVGRLEQGRFEQGFARLIATAGLLPPGLLDHLQLLQGAAA